MFKSVRKKLSSLTPLEVFICLTIISLTIFLVKFFGIKSEWRTIKVEVIRQNWVNNFDPYGYRAPYWLSDKVKIGQVEKDNSGKVIARLVDAENYERRSEEAELYLTVQVKSTLNTKTGKYLFKGKYLDLGSGIELNLNNILLEGQIIDNNVPSTGYSTTPLLVTVRARNVEPWIISELAVHDQMFNRATNTPVAEIVDIKTENPSSQLAKINDQNHLEFSGNDTKDLVLQIKINAFKEDEKWYFAGHQNVKTSNDIYLYTDKVNLYSMEVENVQILNH